MPIMKEKKDIRLNMVISQRQKDMIDKWRSQQEDLPSRSEAIRRLVNLSLEAHGVRFEDQNGVFVTPPD